MFNFYSMKEQKNSITDGYQFLYLDPKSPLTVEISMKVIGVQEIDPDKMVKLTPGPHI